MEPKSVTDRGAKAKELFFKGCNCCQSVFSAFAEDLGLDTQTALMLSSTFGGGMGRLREVCGAVSAMLMIAGLKQGYYDIEDKQEKIRTYELVQSLAGEFKDKYSTIICRELIDDADTSPVPSDRTDEYYKKRKCAEYVEYAAMIAQKRFFEKENQHAE